MKITICGSMHFGDQMAELERHLVAAGHEVHIPQLEFQFPDDTSEMSNDDHRWQQKGSAMQTHFNKIKESDAILVANYEKRGIPGYVGSNTMMELGLAYFLNKKIYLLFPIPGSLPARPEILALEPVILDGTIASLL